jgi:DNA-binding CsgD family transcriptional regulator
MRGTDGLGSLQTRPMLHRLYVRQAPRVLPLLTTRQTELVELVRAGVHHRKALAYRLGITEKSLSVSLGLLYRRLQAHGYQVDCLASLMMFALAPEAVKLK